MSAPASLDTAVTFYLVAHPDGGWAAADPCHEHAYVTFCRQVADELAASCGGTVAEYRYQRQEPLRPPALDAVRGRLARWGWGG